MKRSFVVVAVALTAVLPVAARADLLPALSQELLDFIATVPESHDFAVGEGKISPTMRGVSDQVVFSAHGSPVVADGHVRFNTLEGDVHGTVDCLFVETVDDESARAALSGRFDEPLAVAGVEFEAFVLVVEDNGEPEPSNNDPTPDRVLPLPTTTGFTEGETDCGLALALLGRSEPLPPVVQGNVVVKDRSP
jgi:hypothetical protein